MKYFFCLFFSLITVTTLCAQSDYITITGKVIDSSTQQPLSKASVFCQNTTLGTVTDNDGFFKLSVPAGGYDLVVSYTGFDNQQVRIGNNTPLSNLLLVLKQKDKTLQEVAVVGSSEVVDGLAKYGRFFMDEFIGSTPNAAQCTVQNPQALKFYFSKKRNRLKVLAKEDLIISNPALGYTIRYQLDSFTYEYNNNISSYTGYPFFEKVTGSPEQEAVVKNNRINAYQGSRLHFMRSWYNKSLAQDGFTIETVNNTETFSSTPIENPYDTTIYQLTDSIGAEIMYTGKLRIKYKGQPHPDFVKLYKLPPQIKVQLSIAEINGGFIIEKNGYFYDQADVTNTGYWSWKKLADILPYDYNGE